MITISASDVHYIHEVLCAISCNQQLPSPVHGWVKTIVEAREEQAKRYIEEREERANRYVPCRPIDKYPPLPILPDGMSSKDTEFPEWIHTDQHRRAIWFGKLVALHDVRLIDIAYHTKLPNAQIRRDLQHLVKVLTFTYPRETSEVYLKRSRSKGAAYQVWCNGKRLHYTDHETTALKHFANALKTRHLNWRQYFKLR